MPFISKPNTRQTGTPSPTPGDVFNTLLVVKDTVNATLLNEHTKLAELSNILSEVEDQIRNAAEQTIKNLKTEFEKRRRKIVPGIKRLQDSLKSLSKSESKCKASERHCKNADAKKAKRRIKEAQKTLQDFTSSDIEYGIVTFVADQITVLCQQLMQVPTKFKSRECREDSFEIQRAWTDTDSEGSSRVNTPTSHIYTEIDTLQQKRSTYITAQNSTDTVPPEETNSNKDNGGNSVTRLNSVVLFSSDSEDDYGFGNKKKHNTIKQGSVSRQSRSSKKLRTTQSKSTDYEILDKPTTEDLFRSSNGKVSSRFGMSTHTMSPSPTVYDDYEKPLKHESLAEPIKQYMQHISTVPHTDDPNKFEKNTHSAGEQTGKNETTVSCSFILKTKDESSPNASRSTPKRLLPATPKNISDTKEETKPENKSSRLKSTYFHPKFRQEVDETDASFLEDTNDSLSLSTAINTIELLNAAQDFVNSAKTVNGAEAIKQDMEPGETKETTDTSTANKKPTSIETDYIDLEEIKFRETVRSARREIIDKLKSKYVHTNNSQTHPCNTSKYQNDDRSVIQTKAPEDSLLLTENTKANNHQNHNFSYEYNDFNDSGESAEKVYSKTSSHKSDDSGFYIEYNSDIHENNVGIYRSKLVYTYNANAPRISTKYNESSANDSNSLVSSTIKLFENASATDDTGYTRTRKHKPVVKYGTGSRYRSISEPRTAVSSLKENSMNYLSTLMQPTKALQPRKNLNSSNGNDNSKYSSIENTSLSRSCTENDLLNLVKNESSSSIRKQWSNRRSSSMTPRVRDIPQKVGPNYEHWFTFSIPEQTSRCFISAIAVLDDKSVVLLEERHSFLHLFDRTFKHKDQYRLLDTPRGCIKINSDTVAVAFPYKKCICTYSIEMSAILSKNETSVLCGEWIVDIAFSNNLFYVLCKAGEIHVLTDSGTEYRRIVIGMTGALFVPPFAKYIFILGEGRVSKFDTNGSFISSKADIDAHSMVYLENRIYVPDRQRHRLVPLSDSTDVQNLIDMKIEFPSALSSSKNGDILLVSQFEESMDLALTRKIRVLRRI